MTTKEIKAWIVIGYNGKPYEGMEHGGSFFTEKKLAESFRAKSQTEHQIVPCTITYTT